jgi:hypothetical protein
MPCGPGSGQDRVSGSRRRNREYGACAYARTLFVSSAPADASSAAYAGSEVEVEAGGTRARASAGRDVVALRAYIARQGSNFERGAGARIVRAEER